MLIRLCKIGCIYGIPYRNHWKNNSKTYNQKDLNGRFKWNSKKYLNNSKKRKKGKQRNKTHWGREETHKRKADTNKMLQQNAVSVIILNVNGLNKPIKRHWYLDWI